MLPEAGTIKQSLRSTLWGVMLLEWQARLEKIEKYPQALQTAETAGWTSRSPLQWAYTEWNPEQKKALPPSRGTPERAVANLLKNTAKAEVVVMLLTLTIHQNAAEIYKDLDILVNNTASSGDGPITGLGALNGALMQAVRSSGATNIARDSAWSLMWPGWQRPTRQHDAAEFLQHVCQKTDCAALLGGWEARRPRAGAYEIIDEQFTCPHIRLLYTDRGIRKTRQTFQLQINAPTFTDHAGSIGSVQYQLHSGVLHIGKVVTAGHYQAFYIPGDAADLWASHMIHDDGKAATTGSVCAFMPTVYLSRRPRRQGISLIVGLGDYSGGELAVEGNTHDIRYRPLEFNGWTQRHWTQPFVGERFSLVWFTPAGCEAKPGLELFETIARSESIPPTVPSSLSTPSASFCLAPLTRLYNGLEIPRLGFGTWQLQAEGSSLSCEKAIVMALEAGYRLIDTASIYKNETAVGQALRDWPGGSGVFVCSKCSPYEMGYQRARDACYKSLERLGRDCLDLYLIHWPALPKKPHSSPEHRRARIETWKALEDLYRQGIVRAIGVSNFTAQHLQQLEEDGAQVMPMVNQIEVHPLYIPKTTIQFCRSNNIVVEAYAPLGGGPSSNVGKSTAGEVDGTKLLLGHPEIGKIASETCRTPAQVVLRWALQQDLLVIPRSSNASRIRENAALFDFELSEDQLCRMEDAW
ncbi:unnamed protein product [Symbiodinium sp. CCMP2592]|nr:unnamed protein product [Symbiodinium sp. CCMP2592]